MKFTVPILEQMLSYAEAADEDGWFYGNKRQFCQRHDKIVKWLKDEIQKRHDAAQSPSRESK